MARKGRSKRVLVSVSTQTDALVDGYDEGLVENWGLLADAIDDGLDDERDASIGLISMAASPLVNQKMKTKGDKSPVKVRIGMEMKGDEDMVSGLSKGAVEGRRSWTDQMDCSFIEVLKGKPKDLENKSINLARNRDLRNGLKLSNIERKDDEIVLTREYVQPELLYLQYSLIGYVLRDSIPFSVMKRFSISGSM